MPILRQIALNGTGGAFVDVLATIPAAQIEFVEDEAGTGAQGLQIKSLLDNFATTNVFSAGSEPVQIPNISRYPMHGPLLGMGPQNSSGNFNYRAADKLISARSNSATATVLRFTENE